MESEVELVRATLDDRHDEPVHRVLCHRGRLDGHEVVLARSGVGKVNAAVATVALVAAGADRVLFTGVAGGVAPGLSIGDVVVATALVQHDLDVTALGHPVGEVPGEPLMWSSPDFSDRVADAVQASLVDVPVHRGVIASGDQFIASAEKSRWLHQQFGALCAEMEGAAMAQVCHRLGVDFAVVRSLSDTADADAETDFPAFLAVAAERSLATVRAVLASLGGERR